MKVLDLKTPGSGEEAKNRLENLARLTPARPDQVRDLRPRRLRLDEKHDGGTHGLAERCELLLSPVWGRLDPAQLAGWMLADGVPARLQVQLHKILWGEARGR